jgi:hypothetical protein
MRLTYVLKKQFEVSALMGIHGYLGPRMNGIHVLDQRICEKVKEKLVLSVMVDEGTWISLGPCFIVDRTIKRG